MIQGLGFPVVPVVSWRKHGASSSTSRNGSSADPSASTSSKGVAQSGASGPSATKCRTAPNRVRWASTTSANRVSNTSVVAPT